ncbi:MAG TPA: hypothetical protein PKK95_04025 [Vicinamibacterales bacterium]|nr:hypothetical protein [Acidobacteriota bacterium]HOC17409.1 hypothetical protein [Vicinamibacterales bacterium]
MSVPRCALAVAAFLLSTAAVGAQTPNSSTLGAELAQLLEQRQLNNVAAKDPEHPGFFVAASHIPGQQLLVLSARSTAPDYVEYVLGASKYDEVYATLNFASAPDGKLLVQDMGCDGLRLEATESGTDVAYLDAAKTAIFNGDWKKQGVSEQEYRQTFEEVEARYARALSLLVEQLKRPATE